LGPDEVIEVCGIRLVPAGLHLKRPGLVVIRLRKQNQADTVVIRIETQSIQQRP
jgi:hypothetical protein